MYKQQASIITRCADYSPPPLWTDRRCPPSCSCMSPKGLSCQSSPALLSDYYSLSRRPAAFLLPALLVAAGCAAIEKRVLYRVVSWLNDINSSHPVCQAMPLRQKAVGLLFKVFFIIQTSLMVESNCQILCKQCLWIRHCTMCDFHNFGLIFAGQCTVCLKG